MNSKMANHIAKWDLLRGCVVQSVARRVFSAPPFPRFCLPLKEDTKIEKRQISNKRAWQSHGNGFNGDAVCGDPRAFSLLSATRGRVSTRASRRIREVSPSLRPDSKSELHNFSSLVNGFSELHWAFLSFLFFSSVTKGDSDYEQIPAKLQEGGAAFHYDDIGL